MSRKLHAHSPTTKSLARVSTYSKRSAPRHEAHAARIAASDPVRRLPPREALEARETQLASIEGHVAESVRLDVAAELRAAQEREASGIARAARRAGLLKAAPCSATRPTLRMSLRSDSGSRAALPPVRERVDVPYGRG